MCFINYDKTMLAMRHTPEFECNANARAVPRCCARKSVVADLWQVTCRQNANRPNYEFNRVNGTSPNGVARRWPHRVRDNRNHVALTAVEVAAENIAISALVDAHIHEYADMAFNHGSWTR